MDNRNYYDQIKRNSLNGERSRYSDRVEHFDDNEVRRRKKKIRINVKKLLISCIVAGTIITGSGYVVSEVVPHEVNMIQANYQIAEEQRDFSKEVINPNTHRNTNDTSTFWYDYQGIADGLEEYDDYDMGLYYCLNDLGPKHTDKVLSLIDGKEYYIKDANGANQSRALRHELAMKNYYDPNIEISDEVLLHDDDAYQDALDNFRDTMKARVQIEQSIKDTENEYTKQQKELEMMIEEHDMDTSKDKGKGK